MILFVVAFFSLVGIGLIAGRKQIAEIEANVMGGRVAPGCVVAEAVVLFILALIAYLARQTFL